MNSINKFGKCDDCRGGKINYNSNNKWKVVPTQQIEVKGETLQQPEMSDKRWTAVPQHTIPLQNVNH